LYRLDDLPFRLALSRARAQVGMVRDNLRALQASYRETQEQVRQRAGELSLISTRTSGECATGD
jgi:membrane fusion protein, multidrug efflux system